MGGIGPLLNELRHSVKFQAMYHPLVTPNLVPPQTDKN